MSSPVRIDTDAHDGYVMRRRRGAVVVALRCGSSSGSGTAAPRPAPRTTFSPLPTPSRKDSPRDSTPPNITSSFLSLFMLSAVYCYPTTTTTTSPCVCARAPITSFRPHPLTTHTHPTRRAEQKVVWQKNVFVTLPSRSLPSPPPHPRILERITQAQLTLSLSLTTHTHTHTQTFFFGSPTIRRARVCSSVLASVGLVLILSRTHGGVFSCYPSRVSQSF